MLLMRAARVRLAFLVLAAGALCATADATPPATFAALSIPNAIGSQPSVHVEPSGGAAGTDRGDRGRMTIHR